MTSRTNHFRVQNPVTGCVIDHRLSTRIHNNITLEWILPNVAEALSWPASHVQLIVGQTVVGRAQYSRDRTETFLSDFECTNGLLIIHAVKLPRPEAFTGSGPIVTCLCDFGGCCCFCEDGCAGSGNNGCCRSGNCGHECCESDNPPVEERCRLCTRT